nr:MAG TPA: hypothetical protein [Caudoviricetes sp.]
MYSIIQANKQADRLEGVLRNFLNCHYSEFGVKANNTLLEYDWNSGINFALGVLYERNPDLKDEINDFLGNVLYFGNSIQDVINKCEDENEGIAKVIEIIDKFEALLGKDKN